MTSIWEDLYISITLQQSDPSKLKQFVAHYNNSIRNKSSHISSCRKSHGTDHHNRAKSEIESGTFDDDSRKRESNYSTARTEDKDSIVYGSSSDKKYDNSSSVIKPKNDHDVSALSDDDEKSSNKENDRIVKSKITSSSYEDKKSIKPSLKEKPEPEDNLEKIAEEQKKDEELKENNDVKIEDNKDEKPEEKKEAVEKKEEAVEETVEKKDESVVEKKDEKKEDPEKKDDSSEEKKEETNSPPI